MYSIAGGSLVAEGDICAVPCSVAAGIVSAGSTLPLRRSLIVASSGNWDGT